MREIMFRAKALYDGQWVYGSFVHAGKEYIILPENVERWGGAEFNVGYLVAPETVGQYTGLTDKNGKRIFEGDIVQGSNILHENRTKYEVAFDDGMFCMVDDHGTSWHHAHIDGKAVIGNIHDNPELLEVQHE